ncbi:hypothetical protein ACO14J_002307 [Vibrio parahaemolyticus]
MEIGIDKLKAVVGLATDKIATTLIQDIAGSDLSMSNFSYTYDVLVEREYISLVIQYSAQEVLKTSYFYTLTGSESGSVKISLSDTNGENVLSLDFNANYDFSKAIEHYS